MTRSIGQEFMEFTRYEHLGESEQNSGVPQPPLQLPAVEGQPMIALPKPTEVKLAPLDMLALIEGRRTVRNYSPQPLTLAELSFLLWASQGVKRVSSRPATARTVPSAGARHAFETYVLANRVDGLDAGLYRFMAIEHQLAEVTHQPGLAAMLAEACLQQPQVENAAATFFWVAVRARMYWRYGERGYRYLHLDAGHVCQNMYLGAEAIGCGTCAIAAFDDVKVNMLLDLDGVDQFTIYVASVGKKP